MDRQKHFAARMRARNRVFVDWMILLLFLFYKIPTDMVINNLIFVYYKLWDILNSAATH